jgi:hypothetical protein
MFTLFKNRSSIQYEKKGDLSTKKRVTVLKNYSIPKWDFTLVPMGLNANFQPPRYFYSIKIRGNHAQGTGETDSGILDGHPVATDDKGKFDMMISYILWSIVFWNFEFLKIRL